MAEARTLKLDFVVKKWQNQKLIFGILIYALCRFQNHKNPIGHKDTLNVYAKIKMLEFFEFLLASLLKNTGLVVANDAKKERIKALVANIHRLGEFVYIMSTPWDSVQFYKKICYLLILRK